MRTGCRCIGLIIELPGNCLTSTRYQTVAWHRDDTAMGGIAKKIATGISPIAI
jgi:hypothetical protein